MVNEAVIMEMKQCSQDLVKQYLDEFGYGMFEVSACDYDEPHTAYVVTMNLWGFEYDVVYEFELDRVIVYDHESGADIMSCDVSDDYDIDEMYQGIWYHSMWQHHSDSTSAYEIL